MSRDEVLALPAMIDLPTACRALALGYQLAQRGEFPCPVLRVGRRYLVPTAGIHALLGLTSTRPQSWTADHDGGHESTRWG
jgi:hypothetical protein